MYLHLFSPQTVRDSAIELELARLAQTPFICKGSIFHLVLFRNIDWVFFSSLGTFKESRFAHGGAATSFFIVFTQKFQNLRLIGAGIEISIRFHLYHVYFFFQCASFPK